MKRFSIFLALIYLNIIANAQALNKVGSDKTFEKIVAAESESYKRLSTQLNLASLKPPTVATENFDVTYYRCEWQINPAVRYIAGAVTSYFRIKATSTSITFDLSDTLRVDSIIFNKQPISFNRLANDGLQVLFPTTLTANHQDSITIYYQGEPRRNQGFGAFVQSQHSGIPVLWTLSEPYGSKEWWPCKNGLNDKADSLDVRLINPSSYTPSSIGVMTGEALSAGYKITNYRHRYPIANYLVAFAVTNYAIIKDSVTLSGSNMPVIDYVYPEYVTAFRTNGRFTKESLVLFSKLFGDYPFAKEKYGNTQFGWGGGMEHQTNSFVTSDDPSIIIHETAHQWFGDKITCGSWKDIWLNEGFATYLQLLYNESYDPIYLWSTLDAFAKNITSVPDGSVYVNDTSEASRIFSGRLTYLKGSYLAHMLRWKVGDSAFFKGMRAYLNDPLLAYQFARTTDLQRHLELAGGKNLTGFFQNWLYGEGYPSYRIEWKQDTSDLAFLKINQATSHPSVSFYDMPVPVQFKNAVRDTIIVFDHTTNGQSFITDIGFKADTAIFDPHFWILSNNNITNKIACDPEQSDEKFPFYEVEWMQNINNWVHLKVSQLNQKADSIAENIPVYLHFSGAGKDSVIQVSNLRYEQQTSIQLPFKVETVYAIPGSCFLANSVVITNKGTNNKKNDTRIYPNPLVNNLTVSIKNPTDKNLLVQLHSISGQLLYKQQISLSGADQVFEIPFINLPKGIYIIRLRGERELNFSKKIIK